ncbi:MAG TPA: hypothetical protein VGJ27_01900 [Gaiellaceae bacterium]|jgi:hypothetical protein
MPSRKQRRRRQKERRHEYEFVYVDEEGREVEVDPAELEEAAPRRNGKREPRREPRKGRNERPMRAVHPPSWSRVGKRALIFFPLIFVAFSVLNSNQSLLGRAAIAALYTLFFIPFMYLMDRTMYRAYLKRSGQAPQQRSNRRG